MHAVCPGPKVSVAVGSIFLRGKHLLSMLSAKGTERRWLGSLERAALL